jgi:hypothetical protein
MYPFIYIQIPMLEVRVKQLEKQATEKGAAKAAKAATKEAVEKEAAGKEVAKKEAVEKESAEKEAAEKEDDDEEEEQSWWPSGSSNTDGPLTPIRFLGVKCCFKCPICFNHLYQHKKNLFFHIKYMMTDEFLTPDVVVQHCQLNRLIEAAICDP